MVYSNTDPRKGTPRGPGMAEYDFCATDVPSRFLEVSVDKRLDDWCKIDSFFSHFFPNIFCIKVIPKFEKAWSVWTVWLPSWLLIRRSRDIMEWNGHKFSGFCRDVIPLEFLFALTGFRSSGLLSTSCFVTWWYLLLGFTVNGSPEAVDKVRLRLRPIALDVAWLRLIWLLVAVGIFLQAVLLTMHRIASLP